MLHPDRTMIRVVLVDDDRLVRSGLRMILESADDIAVVGEAGDGHEALAVIARETPDVALVDVRMPRMDGIEATGRLVSRSPSTRIIIVTTFEHDQYVYDALRAGASGFLLKRMPPEDLIAAVRVVAAGDALLSPSVTSRLIEAYVRSPAAVVPSPALDVLTAREREILVAMARGRSNGEISRDLFISEETVRTHVKRVLHKLALRDRVQAVVLAYESGLVIAGRPEPQ